ncbi:MAG: hypothetical protein UU93_C0008G0022 [Candidatus Amesbacteria bacterium GW2011_GWA2_42_12]|uniref:Uncharacterized protein n=1 Tax=Candidatus Amesbacteria bacterium GW2011_GWA2_42_12 TaxID=1618356 RepID=A0A0G0Y6A7_9BACT|nr:MAG: hypothetical protein UU93_C0008G0022 [Candidatus Amesbacteria bacterium GW2011_GWA2_42_12]
MADERQRWGLFAGALSHLILDQEQILGAKIPERERVAVELVYQITEPVTQLFRAATKRTSRHRSLWTLEPKLCRELQEKTMVLENDPRYELYKAQLQGLKALLKARGGKEVDKINRKMVKDAGKRYKGGKTVLLIQGYDFAQNGEASAKKHQEMVPEIDIKVLRPARNPEIAKWAGLILDGTAEVYGRKKIKGEAMMVELVTGAGWTALSPTQGEYLNDSWILVATNVLKAKKNIQRVCNKFDIQMTATEVEFYLAIILLAHEDGHKYQSLKFKPTLLEEGYTDWGSVCWRLIQLKGLNKNKLWAALLGEYGNALKFPPTGKDNEDGYYLSAKVAHDLLMGLSTGKKWGEVVAEFKKLHDGVTGNRRKRDKLLKQLL